MIYPQALPPEVEVSRLAADPDALAVSLEEMRLSLRADSEDEDLTILRNIRGATDFFEIRCGWRLTPATLQALVRACGRRITIPRGPLRDVTSIEVWDCDADEWTIDTGITWKTESRGNEFDVLIDRDSMHLIPGALANGAYNLRINFDAGFDGANASVTTVVGEADDGMVQCLKTLVSLMFQKREEASDAEKDLIVRRYRKFQ